MQFDDKLFDALLSDALGTAAEDERAATMAEFDNEQAFETSREFDTKMERLIRGKGKRVKFSFRVLLVAILLLALLVAVSITAIAKRDKFLGPVTTNSKYTGIVLHDNPDIYTDIFNELGDEWDYLYIPGGKYSTLAPEVFLDCTDDLSKVFLFFIVDERSVNLMMQRPKMNSIMLDSENGRLIQKEILGETAVILISDTEISVAVNVNDISMHITSDLNYDEILDFLDSLVILKK